MNLDRNMKLSIGAALVALLLLIGTVIYNHYKARQLEALQQIDPAKIDAIERAISRAERLETLKTDLESMAGFLNDQEKFRRMVSDVESARYSLDGFRTSLVRATTDPIVVSDRIPLDQLYQRNIHWSVGGEAPETFSNGCATMLSRIKRGSALVTWARIADGMLAFSNEVDGQELFIFWYNVEGVSTLTHVKTSNAQPLRIPAGATQINIYYATLETGAGDEQGQQVSFLNVCFRNKQIFRTEELQRGSLPVAGVAPVQSTSNGNTP